MHELKAEQMRVFREDGWNVVNVPKERGEELCIHLGSHGIHSRLGLHHGREYERVEVEGDLAPDDLQAIIDCWER